MTTTPTAPPVLPGLEGTNLLASLQHEHRRLTFVAEHMAHPAVPQGVAEAVADALDAVAHAVKLQAALVWGPAA